MVDWSLRTAREVTDFVVLVVPRDHVEENGGPVDAVVPGGLTRSESVRAGLAAVPTDVDYVLVHDAARPVPVMAVWRRVIDALRAGAEAVVPVVPVTDTLRERGGSTVDRDRFVAVQTPQGFRAAVLRRAHEHGAEGSDDASLAEATGAKVVLVDGDPTNVKITDSSDLAMVELLVR